MRLTDAADLLQIECILVDPQGDGFIRAIFQVTSFSHRLTDFPHSIGFSGR
jgi:hypothetical protein